MKRNFLIILGITTLLLSLYILSQYFSPVSQLTSGVNVKKFGRVCEYAGECGNIVAVNCRAEVDGPFLYVDKETEEVIEYCGGHCMTDDPTGKYCQNCPPKDWDCE